MGDIQMAYEEFAVSDLRSLGRLCSPLTAHCSSLTAQKLNDTPPRIERAESTRYTVCPSRPTTGT